MISFIIPSYKSSKKIEVTLAKINLFFEEIFKIYKVTPNLIIVDDNNEDKESVETLDKIKMMVKTEFLKDTLVIRNTTNLGAFQSINKGVNFALGKMLLKHINPSKAIVIRDSDDYMTSYTIPMIEALIRDNLLMIPAVKMDMKEYDIREFQSLSIFGKANTLEELNTAELAYTDNLRGIDLLKFFGDGAYKRFFADSYKTLCVKDIPNNYEEYYDLFNTYALSIYSPRLFEITGGFDLYSVDPASSKAYDLCTLRILGLIIRNILRKSLEYYVTSDKSKMEKDFEELINLEVLLRTSTLCNKPAIFRMVKGDSLSSGDLESKEYFYFTDLKDAVNHRRSNYFHIHNMRKSFMFLKSNDIEELIYFYKLVSRKVLQDVYTPFVFNESFNILHKGDNWVSKS